MMFVVLFAAMLGCRNEFIELCAGEYEIISAVVIESECVTDDGTSPVPTRDTTNAGHYRLRAHVVNERGMNMIQNVEWRVSDPTLVDLAITEADPEFHREATALIRTTADILDRGGEVEPEATITACVINDCSDYNSGEGCAQCVPEICSVPHTVRSVVNAEGAWELQGATFPFPVQLYASQTGRTLEAISSFYRPEIHGRQINFTAGENWHYIGQFSDHRHVTGEVIESPSGTSLGTWTATKCPDSGCSAPVP